MIIDFSHRPYSAQTLFAFSKMAEETIHNFCLEDIVNLKLEKLDFLIPLRQRLLSKIRDYGIDFNPDAKPRDKDSVNSVVRILAIKNGFIMSSAQHSNDDDYKYFSPIQKPDYISSEASETQEAPRPACTGMCK